MNLRLLILVAALSAGGAAYAQAPPGGPSPEMMAARQAVMKACGADMKSLCAGKEGREAMMCLRENNAKASPGCKDALSKLPRRPPPQ